MVRQYIGARYVPKFDGEWDNAKIYEPLTIVSFNNSSYTSKKEVPAGVLPTDTEYWAVSGTMSGQILDLQQRMATIESDLSPIENDVDFLKNKTSDLINRKFILVGDSYAMTLPAYTPWTNIFASYTGADCTILANSGGGFVASGDYGTFENHLVNTPIIDDVTDIIVCGGANDNTAHNAGATSSAVQLAIKHFIDTARNLYPEANIYIGFIGNSTTPTYFTPLKVASEAYKKACLEKGCHFIDGYTAVISDDLMHDYLHPTTAGMIHIASYVINAVNGDSIEDVHGDRIIITPNPLINCSLGDPSIYTRFDKTNNIITIHINERLQFNFNNQTQSTPQWIKLCDLSPVIDSDVTGDVNVIAQCRQGQSVSELGMSLRILSGSLYIRPVTAVTDLNIFSIQYIKIPIIL